MDLINGDKFLLMVDIVLRKKERIDYYHVNGWEMNGIIQNYSFVIQKILMHLEVVCRY